MADQLHDYTRSMVERARFARDHNDSQPEPAWSTGERLTVGLILENGAVLDAEGYTEDEAKSRLGGDLYFYGYPADVGTWLAAARKLLNEPAIITERPPPSGLLADPFITCTVLTANEDGDAAVCGEQSRFSVERSDGDTSYGAKGGSEEACEAHLADAVASMIDGDENVQAMVAIRWDRGED